LCIDLNFNGLVFIIIYLQNRKTEIAGEQLNEVQ